MTIPAPSDQGVHSADGDSLPKRGRPILRILTWLFLGLILFLAVLVNTFIGRRAQGARK